jgi:hypothetical protein
MSSLFTQHRIETSHALQPPPHSGTLTRTKTAMSKRCETDLTFSDLRGPGPRRDANAPQVASPRAKKGGGARAPCPEPTRLIWISTGLGVGDAPEPWPGEGSGKLESSAPWAREVSPSLSHLPAPCWAATCYHELRSLSTSRRASSRNSSPPGIDLATVTSPQPLRKRRCALWLVAWRRDALFTYKVTGRRGRRSLAQAARRSPGVPRPLAPAVPPELSS